MTNWPPRQRLLEWLLWAACALAVASAAAVIFLPLGGQDRISGAAIPIGVAAVAIGALALLPNVERWISLVLYVLAPLALTYGLMSLASLPLRLVVLGTCPEKASACPIGYEPAMSAGESIAVQAGIALGILAVLAVLAAVEVRYQPRLRVFGRAPQPAATPTVSSPAPPPVMKPSAIVKKRRATADPEEKSAV